MLTEIGSASNASFATLLLSRDEASLFDGLRNNLPRGWVVELKPDTGMAWVAFIFCEDDPRSRPLFTVCRWTDRVGLFVQWMDGTASSAVAFTELEPIMDLIPNGIFASAETRLATVPNESWTDTKH